MAQKKSSRRAAKKSRKPTVKRKAVAKKKPAKRKPSRKKPKMGMVAKMVAKAIPVAGSPAGEPTYVIGGTIPPAAP